MNGTPWLRHAQVFRHASAVGGCLHFGTPALFACILLACGSDGGVTSDDEGSGGDASTVGTGGDGTDGTIGGGGDSSGGESSSGGSVNSGGSLSSGGGTGPCAGGEEPCPCLPLGGCPLGLNCVEGLCLELGPDVPSCSDEELAGVDCHAEATCVNLDGNPTCTCRSGLYGDGQTCSAMMHCGNAEVQPQPFNRGTPVAIIRFRQCRRATRVKLRSHEGYGNVRALL